MSKNVDDLSPPEDREENTSSQAEGRMRVLVADDHGLVRESVGAIMESEGSFVVRLAATLPEAVGMFDEAGGFDLILLDYDMPGMNGLEGIERMIEVAGDCPVALLTGMGSPEMARKALDCGAAGFVPKTLGTQAMLSAVRFMIAGEKFLPLDFISQSTEPTPGILSQRETEVLKGICEGKSNKEIANELALREVTVKLHVKTLTRKLEARNRTHAAMIARDRSLV